MSYSIYSGACKHRSLRRLTGVALAALLLSQPSVAQAESFAELLPVVLETHDRVKAAESELSSAREGISIATGAYKPTVTVRAQGGHERQNKVSGLADTSTGFSQITLRGNQLIWDMGGTLEAIDRSEMSAHLAEVRLRSTMQDLIREALDAYLTLLQAYNSYNYALESESSIKEQTQLEDALVERNSGLASDLLQAKASLAGAEVARIQAEGALITAKNRFQNVFKRDPGNLETFTPPRLPIELVPASLEEATTEARENNLSLIIAAMEVEIAKSQRRSDKISITGATFNLVGESLAENNVGGTLGEAVEHIIKVEANVPLYNGGRDVATYRQSLSNESTARSRLLEAQHGVDETVRNAWQSLQTSQETADLLETQANIAGEFLEVAKRERQLGNRSLIDILSQEVQFVSALSAAEMAKTSVALAVYNLLHAVGQLDTVLFHEG